MTGPHSGLPWVYVPSLVQDCSGSAYSPENPSENEGSASTSSLQVLSGHQIPLTVILCLPPFYSFYSGSNFIPLYFCLFLIRDL